MIGKKSLSHDGFFEQKLYMYNIASAVTKIELTNIFEKCYDFFGTTIIQV